MEALIAQCLGSVQLEVGILPELQPVQVASVLRDLETSFIPDRGISIRLEFDDALCINADETLLTSALSNLLHNAAKFKGRCAPMICGFGLATARLGGCSAAPANDGNVAHARAAIRSALTPAQIQILKFEAASSWTGSFAALANDSVEKTEAR